MLSRYSNFLYSPPEARFAKALARRADQPWAGIFHILYSRSGRKPTGYSLLLSILMLSVMLTIGLTVTNLIISQVRFATRVVDAMKALAAADSGIERVLYIDFKVASLTNGQVINSNEPPFNSSTYKFTVSATVGVNTTTLNSTGTYGTTQRAVEVNY